MNSTLALVMQKNSADIEAIVAKIGIANLLSLTPHIFAIMQTIQAGAPSTEAAAPQPGL